MESFLQDVRFAARSLSRNPAFAAVALLTLALGIGANAAVFSIVNGVVLRPLPYPEPDELVRVNQASPERGIFNAAISFVDLEDWREQTRSFSAIAGFLSSHTTLTERGEPIELPISYVTEDFFPALGSPAALGRPLLEEDVRQSIPNAVISHRLWRMIFDSDPGAIGSSMLLDGEPHTVVGVMPASFRYPASDMDVWVPYSLLTEGDVGPTVRGNRHLQGIARVATGVSPEVARSELNALAARLEAENPESSEGWGAATVLPLRAAIVGDVDRALVVVLAVVGFILLIGCVNLANLLLARTAARGREVAIRTVMGAGRTRLVRQIVTENLLLALLGGGLGLLLSIWGLEALLALSADTLPRVEDVRVDGRVIAFGLALAVVTGLLFSLFPALRAAYADPQENLKGGRGLTAAGGSRRLRSTLVVTEVTLAVVLVIGAGLMARSFLELRSVDPGFEPEQVLTVGMRLNVPVDLPAEERMQHIILRREALIERAAALPGVTAAGTTNTLPLRGEGESLELTRADGLDSGTGAPMRAFSRYVSPGYFRAMGIPLISGESLPEDWTGAQVPVVLSAAAARAFWPDEDPVGQVAQTGWGEMIVTGVVGDVRQIELAEEPPPTVYLPQAIGPRLAVTLVVRAAGDPLALAGPIRQSIQELDANQPIRSVATLQGVMSESVAQDRFFTLLFAVFGGLALGLAALGIYGVLAYSVGQRTQEIGVRMALGARAADVLRMVIGSGMLLVGIGVGLGTVAALLLSRVLESQLYGISATDPTTFLAAPFLLAAVALLASYLPARRAVRVEPTVALRSE